MSRVKKTYGQLYEEWEYKIAKYKETYPDVEIIVKWGCHWLKERLSGEAHHFVTKIYKKIPYGQYAVANAIVPSRAEVFRMHWSADQSSDQSLEAVDLSSHYASVMINQDFPVGKYYIL